MDKLVTNITISTGSQPSPSPVSVTTLDVLNNKVGTVASSVIASSNSVTDTTITPSAEDGRSYERTHQISGKDDQAYTCDRMKQLSPRIKSDGTKDSVGTSDLVKSLNKESDETLIGIYDMLKGHPSLLINKRTAEHFMKFLKDNKPGLHEDMNKSIQSAKSDGKPYTCDRMMSLNARSATDSKEKKELEESLNKESDETLTGIYDMLKDHPSTLIKSETAEHFMKFLKDNKPELHEKIEEKENYGITIRPLVVVYPTYGTVRGSIPIYCKEEGICLAEGEELRSDSGSGKLEVVVTDQKPEVKNEMTTNEVQKNPEVKNEMTTNEVQGKGGQIYTADRMKNLGAKIGSDGSEKQELEISLSKESDKTLKDMHDMLFEHPEPSINEDVFNNFMTFIKENKPELHYEMTNKVQSECGAKTYTCDEMKKLNIRPDSEANTNETAELVKSLNQESDETLKGIYGMLKGHPSTLIKGKTAEHFMEFLKAKKPGLHEGISGIKKPSAVSKPSTVGLNVGQVPISRDTIKDFARDKARVAALNAEVNNKGRSLEKNYVLAMLRKIETSPETFIRALENEPDQNVFIETLIEDLGIEKW